MRSKKPNATAPQSRVVRPATAADCPVMVLAAKIEGLRTARVDLDEQLLPDFEVDQAADDLFDAKAALEQLVTFTRATSPEGALYQLELICENLWDMFEQIGDDGLRKNLRPFEAAIKRLAYSIAGVLSKTLETETAGRLMGLYMSPSKDPLRMFDLGAAGKSVAPLFPRAKKRSK